MARNVAQAYGFGPHRTSPSISTQQGSSPEFGARPMERAVETLIAQPLVKAGLEGGNFGNPDILARDTGGKGVFEQR